MDDITPQGEFHHFQLVNPSGEVPFSITIMVHVNRSAGSDHGLAPIDANEVIQFHDALQTFNGDFITALAK